MNFINLANKKKLIINQIKSRNKFENLKSDYFLRKVFYNLQEKKYFDIVKYNNYIKKRINLNNKDYEELSKIEIEIKPINDKYGKFINMKGGYEEFYHIYFNNNNEEIKRDHIKKNEEVKIIKIKIDCEIESLEKLFYDCKCMESIYFKKFYRNNIKNMSTMFSECSLLKELNINNFNTNNVTNMEYIFGGCSSLKELNIKKFNTNNVTNMYRMFFRCSPLLIKKLKLNIKI